jgi:hypothetical protein
LFIVVILFFPEGLIGVLSGGTLSRGREWVRRSTGQSDDD